MDEFDDEALGSAEGSPDEALESEVLFTWDTKAGIDLATRYLLTDKGVWEYYGISVAKGAARTILGAASFVAALAGQGRLSLTMDRMTKVRSKEFMSWDNVAEVTINAKKRKIELVGLDESEMSIRCTEDAFETAQRIVEEQIAFARKGKSG